MPIVPPARNNLFVEEIDYKSAVSEALLLRLAGQNNFLNQFHYYQKQFFLNGFYEGAVGFTAIDGLEIFPFNAEIFDVGVFNIEAGISGTTEIDIQIATTSGGSFSSIFTTRPAILSTAPNFSYFRIGETNINWTAPVLNSVITSPIDGKLVRQVTAGSAVRIDLLSSMNNARGCGVILFCRSR